MQDDMQEKAIVLLVNVKTSKSNLHRNQYAILPSWACDDLCTERGTETDDDEKFIRKHFDSIHDCLDQQ